MVARVALVGAASGGGNVATITNLTWPAGIAPGDVAIVGWVMQNTVTPVTPFGWAAPGAFDANSARTRLMWHACDGTETGSLSLTNAEAAIMRQSAVLLVYRGLDPATPINGTPQYLAETTAQATHTCPAVTPTIRDAVILTVVAERASTGSTGWTPPTGYTERADSDGAATGNGGTIIAAADDGMAVLRPAGVAVTPPAWASTNTFAALAVATCTVALTPLPHSGWGASI